MKKFVKETGKKLATGALAILATIGGASAAPNLNPNPMPNNTDFQIDSTYNGVIPIKGYQTQKVYTYELHLSWGAMEFVFDRGVYNVESDRITKKLAGDTIYKYCEAGVDGGAGVVADDTTGLGVGKWCGFDGSNNHVDVENLGNGNIRMTAGCTEGMSADQVLPTSSVDMQIGVLTADIGDANDNWVMPSGDGATTVATMKPKTGDPASMTFATGSGSAVTALIQKKFDLSGAVSTQDNANQVTFYLNITGTPTQSNAVGLSNNSELDTLTSTPTTGDSAWEQIGNINLSFVPQEDLETTA